MRLNLVVLSEGKATGQVVPIKLPQFIVGRDAQCHLRPASPVISKRHCALITRNGKVFVRDFESTNGTFVNDVRVENQRELKNNDVLKIGPVVFKVQLEVPVAVDKPTPLPVNRREEGGEEDAAAMLLLPEEGIIPATQSEATEDNIPTGTTIMDLPAVPASAEKEAGAEKGGTKKDVPAKVEHVNTASAAAAILAKYSRRTRN